VDGEETGGVVGHVADSGGEVGGFVGKRGEFFEEFLAGLPLEEAAVTPVGDVLLANGLAVEGLAEDGFDVGDGVEPFDEIAGGGGAFEAAVEFVADGAGEAGDFGDAGHGGGDFRF